MNEWIRIGKIKKGKLQNRLRPHNTSTKLWRIVPPKGILVGGKIKCKYCTAYEEEWEGVTELENKAKVQNRFIKHETLCRKKYGKQQKLKLKKSRK